MDTSLEQIQSKIAELEARLANLKIAEREVEALEKAAERVAARQTKKPESEPVVKVAKVAKAAKAPKAPKAPKATGLPKAVKAEEATAPVEDTPAASQTIGAAITAVLQEHGTSSAKAIASAVQASGKDINNRAISFALQAMKKRGLVKSADGEWSLKGRARRAA